MKIKRILSFVLVAGLSFGLGSAFTNVSYKPEYNNVTFRKRVGIKPTSNGTPDTNALLQIGDADSSNLGHIRFPSWTDTSNMRLAGHAKRGVLIFSYRDTSLWIYTGARWKKVGS